MNVRILFLIVLSNILASLLSAHDNSTSKSHLINKTITKLKFDFGPGKVKKGYTQVLATDTYTPAKGFGIVSKNLVRGVDRNTKDALTGDFLTSDHVFYFLVDLPEGNYKVAITLGDVKGTSLTTVKAESRRLMLEKVQTRYGEIVTESFLVNIRTPSINDTNRILIKPREKDYLNWDNHLTFEFNNAAPCICAVEIEKVENATVLFLAGNSTVTDQEDEPYAAWGQMIPAFFNTKVVVANYAESGESLKSFEAGKRFDKIFSLIKKDDFLLLEFAHNDQKPGVSHADAFTDYKELLKKYVLRTRQHGATPILITSMHRRRFDESGKIINTLGDYPEAMRQVAMENNVPLIDLHEMSKYFYEALGIEDSKKAFVHYPANTYTNQPKDLEDNTHFNNYGGYELAKCVVTGMKKAIPELSKFLKNHNHNFNPTQPDDISLFDLPASPRTASEKPDGN